MPRSERLAARAADGALRARGVTVERGARVVARGVDLSLSPGECAGIIGPNAGGKTSLLLGLRGLLPAAGEISLCGLDPRGAPRAEVARRVAVVPQGNEFAFSLEVEEMVLLGRSPYRRPWQGWSGEDRRIAARWLERVGLSAVAGRAVDELSGGERRRVFLARALAQETPLLFLDEPLAGLDPAASEEIGALLGELRAERSRTMVIVLHDLARIAPLCDRVLGLAGGEVVIDGDAGAALDAARLERLFGVPWIEARRADGARLIVPRARAPATGGSP